MKLWSTNPLLGEYMTMEKVYSQVAKSHTTQDVQAGASCTIQDSSLLHCYLDSNLLINLGDNDVVRLTNNEMMHSKGDYTSELSSTCILK